MEQMSDLFVEHCDFKFQDETQIFFILQQLNIENRDSESIRGCNWSISCFFQVLHHITCMTGLC